MNKCALLNPKLRFKGFSRLLSVIKINDFINLKSGVDSKNNLSNTKTGMPWIKLGSLDKNIINWNRCEYLDNEIKNLTKPGDMLVCWSTNPGLAVMVDKVSLFSTAFYKFENEENKLINKYIYFWLDKNKHKIENLAVGSTLKKVNMQKFKSVIIEYPPIEEQTKIAKFFSLLDKQIDLLVHKLQLLEVKKKYYLNNLFCSNDSLIPKLRFKGFSVEWESKTLIDICQINKGEQINNALLKSIGKYYYLNGGTKLSGYTDNFNKIGNTISISEGGESCGFVNFNINNFWSGGHLYTLDNLNKDLNAYFLFSELKNKQRLIMKLRVGSGLPNIQKGILCKFLIEYPSIQEQTKIAKFFTLLDKQIENNKNKKEKIINKKTYYLNNMFI